MAEIWPSRLRASGMGLAYGAGNLGSHRSGRAGGDRGSSNFVSPQATADALIPAMNYFAAWYVLATCSGPVHRLRDARHDRS